MRQRIYLAFALALALVPASAAQELKAAHEAPATGTRTPSNATAVVARVNSVPVTQRELDAEINRVFPFGTMHGGLPKEYADDIKKKALQSLIDTELVYQEAKRRNLQIPKANWDARLREIRSDYKSDAEFEATMKKYFGSRQGFESRLRHDILLDLIWLQEVKNKAGVSDAEVRLYYEKNQAQFVQPESVSLQTISILFRKNAPTAEKQAARKRAEAILPKARAAKSYEEFGVLAEQFSEDGWRVMMGDHKFVHRTGTAPEFLPAFAMKPGETSAIIEGAGGFVMIRVNKRFPQKHLTFTEVQPSIRAMLEKERLAQRAKSFHESLRKAAKIEVL